jgi:hypothetical protein
VVTVKQRAEEVGVAVGVVVLGALILFGFVWMFATAMLAPPSLPIQERDPGHLGVLQQPGDPGREII